MKRSVEINTKKMMKYYGERLINGELGHKEVIQMANLFNFQASKSDGATVADMLFGFVQELAPKLPKDDFVDTHSLHGIVNILLKDEKQNYSENFLQRDSLVQTLLAYEKAHSHDLFRQHFVKDSPNKYTLNVEAIEAAARRKIDAISETLRSDKEVDAQEDVQSRPEELEPSKPQTLPISFFMVMSHPASKIASGALLVMGLAALLTLSLAVSGVAAAASLTLYASKSAFEAATLVTALGAFGVVSGAKAPVQDNAESDDYPSIPGSVTA